MTREYYIELVKKIGEAITERAEEIVGTLDEKRTIRITAVIEPDSIPIIEWSNTIYNKANVIRD